MFRILLAMIVGGGVLVFLGIQEMRLAGASKSEPQSITCAQLIKNGVGDNAHVAMGDFYIPNSAFCYEGSKYGSEWKTIWIPAVPTDGEYFKRLQALHKAGKLGDGPIAPQPHEIRLIIKSTKVKNEAQLNALDSQETIQGMIVNKIDSLGTKERKILAESYRGVDLDSCLILEHGREPASAGKSFGMMGGGGLLSVLGVLGFVKRKS
jgi:hypothetical protein